MRNPRYLCFRCQKHHASFHCKACGIQICINCVWVTVIKGVWNFYCSSACAPSTEHAELLSSSGTGKHSTVNNNNSSINNNSKKGIA